MFTPISCFIMGYLDFMKFSKIWGQHLYGDGPDGFYILVRCAFGVAWPKAGLLLCIS